MIPCSEKKKKSESFALAFMHEFGSNENMQMEFTFLIS